MSLLSRISSAALAFTLALSLAPIAPLANRAFADDVPASQSGSARDEYASTSPCVPSESELEAYAAEGTLDDRIAFQESLANEEYDAGLIESARAQESAALSGTSTYQQTVPQNWESGMSSIGNAHVLALRVTFPDDAGDAPSFDAGDDINALQSLIGPITPGVTPDATEYVENDDYYPYESLHEYYLRSSYGKLSIDGAAFEYTAQHPASHYNDGLETLYVEALEQLDEKIDYSKFDGNGDGRIDALYVHFACDSPQWGTAWWSNEQICQSEGAAVLRDGVRLWNSVSLHNPSNTIIGARTIIHETGHVLGLPDLYSYLNQSSTHAGVLTFDMMNTNCGDHNGFSKWMLGWVGNDDVVRIVANRDEVIVKDGNNDPVTYAPDAVACADISTYAGDSCGGIVVVSNSDALISGEGLFSSYYLVQYDGYDNNQSVSADTPLGRIDLPSGFRVFRVQANLLPSGIDFAHNNSYGKVHDQLIELVDPDEEQIHADYNGFLIAERADAYGCMYHAGDALTPKTYPSTNFFESLNLGFTGLTLNFVSETPASAGVDAAGSLEVTYSAEFEPSPSDFSITRVDDEPVLNIDEISLKSSSEVQFNKGDTGGGAVGSPETRDMAPYPYLNVDGTNVSVKADVAGSDIKVSYAADASCFSHAQDCILVFPAGTFVIGHDESGDDVLSPEITIELDVAELSNVDLEGHYAGTNVNNFSHTISNTFTTEDGAKHFVQLASGTLRLCTIDEEDPTRVKITNLIQIETGFNDSTNISATGTVGSTAFAVVYPLDYTRTGTCLWFDVDTGAVSASGEFDSFEPAPLIASGNTILTSEPMPQTNGRIIHALDPCDDGSVRTTYAYAQASSLENAVAVNPAHADEAAFASYNEDQTKGSYLIYNAADIVQAVEEQQFDTKTELFDAGCPDVLGDISQIAKFDVGSANILDGIAQTPTGYCVTSKRSTDLESLTSTLTLFDAEGNTVNSVEIPSLESPRLNAVHVGKNGSIAAEYLPSIYDPTCHTQHIVFFDNNLKQQSELLTFSQTNGTWLADGRWLSIGWDVTPSSSGAGSPPDDNPDDPPYQGEFVRYTITDEIDKATDDGDQDGEGEGGEGQGGGQGDDQGENLPPSNPTDDPQGNVDDNAALPSTGDATSTATLALGMTALLTYLALVIAAAKRKTS